MSGKQGVGSAFGAAAHAHGASKVAGFLLVVALLVAWEASVRTGFVQSSNWPAFSVVLQALFDGVLDGELLSVILSTLGRMIQGLALGIAIGVPLGFLIALSRFARLLLLPSVDVLRTIPVPAIIPPLIFLLGVDDALKLFAIAFATVFPIAINTIAGVTSIDKLYKQVGQTFGTPPRMMFFRITLPAALPFILAGLRISIGYALIVTVVAEMIAGQQGVGFFLINAQFAMRASDMYAAVILLAVIAYGLNWLFVRWEARVLRWDRLGDSQASK